MSEHNGTDSSERRVKPAIRYVTWSAIASLIPLIWIGYQMHTAYTEWHYDFLDSWLATQTKVYTREQSDHRFAPLNNMITLAEATSLRKVISETAGRAESNAKKMDIILLQIAEQTALAKEEKLDRITNGQQNTPEWREQRREAAAEYDRAIAYRNCLRDSLRRAGGGSDDCSHLSGGL